MVVLSDAIWRRRFGGDRAVLGRAVDLDGDAYTVVGVMPAGFENVLASTTEVWAPLRYDLSLPQAWGHHLRAVGRLRAGGGLERAARELAALAPSLRRTLPEAHVAAGFLVTALQDEVTRGVRPALLAAAGAVLLLLLLACINVAHLLLARGARRRGELAVRVALGAGRARVVRQLLAESLLLAALGGALGMALAALGVRALLKLAPIALPRASAVAFDGPVLAWGLGITTLVALAFGLAPALRAAGRDLQPALGRSSRRTTGGAAGGRLVTAEVAIAVVLLVGCGLLLRSVQHLLAIPVGFAPSGLLSMQVQTAGHRFDDADATRRFFRDALAAARRVPGVTAAAFTSQLPLSGDDDEYGVRTPDDPPQVAHGAFRYAVSSGYLETLGISLRRGRRFDDHDRAGAPLAAIVSESFARHALAGDALGQRVQIGPLDAPWFTVVGVVGDVKQAALAADGGDAIYVPSEQWPFTDGALWLVARTRGGAAAIAPLLRRAVWSVDRDQPIVRVATMQSRVAAAAARQRFTLVLFEIFAVVALALAAAGLYGVLSGSVAERRREIGVRCALGASNGSILSAVVRQGMRLTTLGMAIGLAAAALATRAMTALLFAVSRLDPLTYLGVAALLLLVAALACCAPAWRASRVDPALALRAE